MDKRICFKSVEVRNLFFQKSLDSFGLHSWNQMILHFEIPRATLTKYRAGILTIPFLIYMRLSKNLSEKDKSYFQKNISFHDFLWGRIKGGNSTYLKHREIFENGRKKAIEAKKLSSIKFDINLSLDKKLAYFIGLFIGDGFTNKYQNYYLTQFTGDKRKEKEFYLDTISEISNHLFNISPLIREEKNTNALRINFYSVTLFDLITKRFKIKAGRKSKEVLIPEEILKSETIFDCIAGIYDAEGCFYFDNRARYKSPYPIIVLHMNNPALIKQISDVFSKFNLKHSFTFNYSTLYIHGKKDITFFLSKIRLLNPRYMDKIEMLNKI